MKDEEYLYRSDVREKAITARSARRTRTHCGKGGAVKLPSDYLTRKELNAMNGEVKSYKLNDPMKWKEFKAMPDDVKVIYITAIRNRWNAPDTEIAKMLGVCKATIIRVIADLGLGKGKKAGGSRPWDKEGFYAWVYGAPETADNNAAYEDVQEAAQDAKEATNEAASALPIEASEKHPANEESVTAEELAEEKTCHECSFDYEAEYHKLLDEHKELCAKLHYVTEEHRAKEIEFERMRAQLDIVYLIFGRK